MKMASKADNETDASKKNRGGSFVASRREFLGPISLGAVAAGTLSTQALAQSSDSGTCSPQAGTTIPTAVTQSLAEPTRRAGFEGRGVSGAEVFANLCKDEGLAALFCCPGNYSVVHAMAAIGIPTYGGRTENTMTNAADGYARATGEVVACSGTEGPGFAGMVYGLANAYTAHTPLLLLASNQTIAGEDREGLQHIDQQPLSTGIKKYGKRLITPNRVYEYGANAFRHLKSGVPGPVHLDFPGEVARAKFTNPSQLKDYYDKTRYRTENRAGVAGKELRSAIDMISKAERPLLIAGAGVFWRKAWDPLLRAVERHEIAVCTSGPTKGQFPDEHRLSANLSPQALMSADLVIFVGQYKMPSPNEYRLNPDIKTIRVHPEQDSIGEYWPVDLGIVADEAAFLEAIADGLPRKKREPWVDELAKARAAFDKQHDGYYQLGLKYSASTNALHPAVIARETADFLYRGTIDPKQTLVGWGGYTTLRFIPPLIRAHRPGQVVVCPYNFGAIGPDGAVMVGAAASVRDGVGPQAAYKGAPTLCMTTDAGIGFSLMELETAAKYKIPLICVVYNNNCWGTWTFADGWPRSVHVHLFQEGIRYDKMAQALGCHGEYVRTPEEYRAALKRSYDIAAKQGIPCLINAQAIKEFSSTTAYPPGPGFPGEPGVGGFQK